MTSAPTSEPTPLERLGGPGALREIVDAFVDRVFDDMMIGFHFRDASREDVKRFEWQFAMRFLGAPETPYEGRPLDEAHAPHPITGGQFHRRMQILREVLEARGAPEDVVELWMEHTERLRPLITREAGSACHQGGCPEG